MFCFEVKGTDASGSALVFYVVAADEHEAIKLVQNKHPEFKIWSVYEESEINLIQKTTSSESKIMPKQINKEMADAFWEEYSKDRGDLLLRCYKALYDAAPIPTKQSEDKPAVSVPEPSERDVYHWFQESTIAHHIEEDGSHISKRAMYIARKACEFAMLSASPADKEGE